MNPIDWLQDNIFYTDAKTKQINDAMRRNAGGNVNPVRPSQADGEPTAYAQHGGGTTYYDTADGRSVYQTPGGQVYDRKSGAQIFTHDQTGETMTYDGPFSKTPNSSDPYVGTNGVNIDGQKIHQGTQVWKVPDSLDGGGNRNNSRVIPGSGGQVQKGTDMSRSFNDLLRTTNTSGYQPFSSNQLPTTGANPFEGTAPKTQSFNPAAPGITGQSYDNYGADGGVAAASSTDRSQFTPMSGKEGRIEGGSERRKGGSLSDALSDTAGINSYMSKFSSGDRERAANRAFLDTEKSMEALRAKEAVNGVVYAQQQHYVAGENADSPAQKISRDEARDISNGRAKAQDFASRKVTETVAAVKQAPVVLEEGAKDGAFQQDKPMFSGSTPAIEGAVEFDNNNDKTLPTFGNNGGYKSGFKKIDTSMGNPFG